MSHNQSYEKKGYAMQKDYRKQVHQLEPEKSDNDRDDAFCVDGVELDAKCVDAIGPQTGGQDEGFVTLYVHNKPLEMKVDTGAKCNVMSKDDFQQLADGERPVKYNRDINLVAYGGSKIETTGIVTLPCCLDGQQHTLPFFLVDRDVVPLLGFRACVRLGIVTMSPHVHHIDTESNADFTKQILAQYKDVSVTSLDTSLSHTP